MLTDSGSRERRKPRSGRSPKVSGKYERGLDYFETLLIGEPVTEAEL